MASQTLNLISLHELAKVADIPFTAARRYVAENGIIPAQSETVQKFDDEGVEQILAAHARATSPTARRARPVAASRRRACGE